MTRYQWAQATYQTNVIGNAISANSAVSMGNTGIANVNTMVPFFTTYPGGLGIGDVSSLLVNANLTYNGNALVIGSSGSTVTISNSGALNATGNVQASYFIGDGSLLTGLPAGYGNVQVTAYAEAGWSGNIIPAVDNVYSLGSSSKQWKDLWVSNSTIYINQVPLSSQIINGSSTLFYANAPVITSGPNAAPITTNITTSANIAANTIISNSFISSGTISAIGNIYANNVIASYLWGDGSNITGLYGNIQVANYLANGSDPTIAHITSNVANNTSNITILQGNVSALTASTTGITSNVTNNASNITILQGNVSTLTSSLNGTTNNVTVLQGNVSTLQSNVSTLTSSLVGVTNTAANNASNITILQGNVSTLTGSLVGVTSDVANNTSNTIVLQGNVSTLTVSTTGITSNVINLQTAVASLTGNVYNDANVSAFLPTYTGNLQGGNLLLGANAFILGNLSVTGTITYFNANAITTNDLFISLANNATTLAQVNNAGLEIGNTNLVNWQYSYFSNAWSTNVGITANGNVTAPYFVGDGSMLSNIRTANIIGTFGNIVAGNVLSTGIVSATGSVLSSGIVSATGNISSAANVSGSNLLTSGAVSVGGKVTIASTVGNVLNTTGNINVGYVYGNVAFVTGLPVAYTNANVAAYLSSGTVSTPIITTGNVTGGNVLTGGSVSVGGIVTIANTTGNVLSTAGNISTGYVYGNGAYLVGLPAGYTNANVTTLLSSGTVSTPIITTGNVTGGNVLTSGAVSIGGKVSIASTVGNVLSTTGNIAAGYYYGNVAFVTGLPASYGDSNVTTLLSSGTVSTPIISTGNVTGGNLLTSGIVSVGGKVTIASTVGTVLSTTGNIAAGYVTIANAVSIPGTAVNGSGVVTVYTASSSNVEAVQLTIRAQIGSPASSVQMLQVMIAQDSTGNLSYTVYDRVNTNNGVSPIPVSVTNIGNFISVALNSGSTTYYTVGVTEFAKT